MMNEVEILSFKLREMSSYIEQQDALMKKMYVALKDASDFLYKQGSTLTYGKVCEAINDYRKATAQQETQE